MIPGSGIGIGFSTQSKAERLATAIQRIVTPSQGIYIGDMIVADGSNLIQSWPSLRGGNTLTNANANLFSVGVTSGFRHLSNSVINTKRLAAAVSAVTLEAWVVCRPSSLPFSDYACATMLSTGTGGTGRFLSGTPGTSTLYSAYNESRRDNVATDLAATGWHAYKRYLGFITEGNTLSVGNDPEVASLRTWLGDIAFVMPLTAATNTTQTNSLFAELIAYYKIIP